MVIAEYQEDRDYNSISPRRGDVIAIWSGFIMNLTSNQTVVDPPPRLSRKILQDSKVHEITD